MYLQMSHALYELNYPALAKTLEKFHGSSILYDKSIFQPGGYEQNLFSREIADFLADRALVTLVHTFGDAELYSVNTNGKNLDVFAPKTVRLVSTNYQTTYTTRDQAYLDYGDYIQLDQTGITYPFSFLQNDELPKPPFVQGKNIVLPLKLQPDQQLVVPSFQAKQKVLSAAFRVDKSETGSLTSLYFNLPTIKTNGQVIYQNKPVAQLHGGVDLSSQIVMLNDSLVNVAGDNHQNAVLSLPTAGSLDLKLFQGGAETKLNFDQLPSPQDCNGQGNSSDSWCARLTLDSATLQPGVNSLLLVETELDIPDQDLPQVCLFKIGQPNECLNKVVIVEPGSMNTTIHTKTFLTTTSGGKYGIKLLWQKKNNNYPWRSMTVKTLHQTDTAQVSIDQLLATFQEKVEMLRPGSGQDVSFTFPTEYFALDMFDTIKPRSEGIKNCRQPEEGNVDKKDGDHRAEYQVSGRAIGCETFFLPELDHQQQYIYAIKGKVLSGVGSRVFLLNPFTKHFDVDTTTRTGSFDLAVPVYPSFSSYNKTNDAFQLVLNMETFAREVNKTQVTDSVFYPLPLNWLTSLHQQPAQSQFSYDTKISSYRKFGTTFYLVHQTTQSETGLLVLPQSYDDGWIALSVAKPTTGLQHVIYNGWGNAWFVPQGDAPVLLVYWPELLVFAGYGVVISCGVYLVIRIFIRPGSIKKELVNTNTQHIQNDYAEKIKKVFVG